MRARHLAIAAAMAMAILPPAAGAARADITLVNQTDVLLRFTITPYAAPGQVAIAVICGQVDVAAGASEAVPQTTFCGEMANVGANGPPNGSGWSATCQAEALSWANGRLTVTGTRGPTGGLTALVCAKQ